jgi:hypothetical protein
LRKIELQNEFKINFGAVSEAGAILDLAEFLNNTRNRHPEYRGKDTQIYSRDTKDNFLIIN